jgi:predicted Zn finger-like uncharacterized protein
MRLICPNCDAEYEVDAALIPDSGRDVQCSNCGHSWFQVSPEVEAAAEAEEALFAPAATPAASAATATDMGEDEGADPEQGGPEPPFAGTRRLDESVLSVLREEAEREALARQAEAEPLETQGDLGLEAPSHAPTVPTRIARLRAEAEPAGGEATASPRGPARRELLPEIDQINASLRPQHERRAGEAAAVAETMGPGAADERRGFRRGFLTSLIVVALAAALYLLAPRIAASLPALSEPLTRYVQLIDGLRDATGGVMQAMIRQLQSLAVGG